LRYEEIRVTNENELSDLTRLLRAALKVLVLTDFQRSVANDLVTEVLPEMERVKAQQYGSVTFTYKYHEGIIIHDQTVTKNRRPAPA
jgi:hypothetical protein